MEFELDERKSQANKVKHGIDFMEARALWGDPEILEITLMTDEEPRVLLVGRIGENHWSAIVTLAGWV